MQGRQIPWGASLDPTGTPCIGNSVLTTWPPRKSRIVFFLVFKFLSLWNIFLYVVKYTTKIKNLNLNPSGHAQLSRKILKNKTNTKIKVRKKRVKDFTSSNWNFIFSAFFPSQGSSWRIFRWEEGEWGRSKQELQTERRKQTGRKWGINGSHQSSRTQTEASGFLRWAFDSAMPSPAPPLFFPPVLSPPSSPSSISVPTL